MEKNKITFSKIFTNSLSKFSEVFNLFEASLFKVIIYFILLNLMMFLPITMQVVNMENPDYSRWGFTFTEDLPSWLPSELPTHCVINDNELTT